MDLLTRKVPAPRGEGWPRISVSDGQGTTASYRWDFGLTDEENHRSAAVDFARDMKGFTPAVVRSATARPSADGYRVTLSRYTEEA